MQVQQMQVPRHQRRWTSQCTRRAFNSLVTQTRICGLRFGARRLGYRISDLLLRVYIYRAQGSGVKVNGLGCVFSALWGLICQGPQDGMKVGGLNDPYSRLQ